MSWNAIANLYDKFTNLCKNWGATNLNDAMLRAALRGHIGIVKLCKNWGATDFGDAMWFAVCGGGHVEVVKLCKKWGAANFSGVMAVAASEGHIDR